MDIYAQIGEKLRVNYNQLFLVAKVLRVSDALCSVDVDGLTLTDVQLRAVNNGEQSKVLVTPKVGSYVLVADLSCGNKTLLAAIAYSEIDKVEITIEQTNLSIDKDGIAIDGGANHGLVKVQELTDRLNAIEKDLNRLKVVFGTGWAIVPQDGGAALKAAAATWASSSLRETQQSDLENTKVKH